MKRDSYLEQIKFGFRNHPVVALLGPRQAGKSTLARAYRAITKGAVHFFDLEDPTDLARLESPNLAFSDLSGLVIIDEIQRRPELFSALRVFADKRKLRFLILGSASRDLIQQSSETLAGRIAYIEVRPFSVLEKTDYKRLWVRGGYPRAYLAKTELDAKSWLQNYTTTFLERDIPQLGVNIPAQTIRKFWLMLAHYHGGIFNAAEIGQSMGASGQTMRRYLDLLSNTFIVRELKPWVENIDKRQVKSPKIYFRDSGIFHFLLGLNKFSEISLHPKLGLSWEGFALEQVTAHFQLTSDEAYFWATHAEAELDLFCNNIGGKRLGFEFKYTDHPKVTKSMQIAIKDLKLKHLYVVYPGKTNFKLSEKISAVAFENLRTGF